MKIYIQVDMEGAAGVVFLKIERQTHMIILTEGSECES